MMKSETVSGTKFQEIMEVLHRPVEANRAKSKRYKAKSKVNS